MSPASKRETGALAKAPVVPRRCRKCGDPVDDMAAIKSGLLGPLDARCLAEVLAEIRRMT